ncbi:helix-turn-helix domain-containing protein [Bacillus sp. B15-48]|uniref:PucR family transcriptional regulator n=1 Tax=Bacillus sp. B15-48 TaxID=1548601 RepID=UPI00193F4E86|nr:helix-turn-helix domain-containing protein [Bacillus sp. B15-48]
MNFSLWDFHSWFEKAYIPHDVHIISEKRLIAGIRSADPGSDTEDFAVICKTADDLVALIHGGNYLNFHNTDIQTVINEANNMISTYREWGRNLKKINIMNGLLKELLECSEKVFPFPIVLIRNDELICHSPSYKNEVNEIWNQFMKMDIHVFNDDCPDVKLQEIYYRKKTVITESPYFENYQLLMNNIWMEGKCFAKLIAFNETGVFTLADIGIIDQLAQAIELNVNKNKKELTSKNYAEFVFKNCIRDNQPIQGELSVTLDLLRWNADDDYLIYYLDPKSFLSSFDLIKIINSIKNNLKNVCVFNIDFHIVIISNIAKKDIDAEITWLQSMTKWTTGFIGQSCISKNFNDLHHFFRQAQYTAEKAKKLDSPYLSAENFVSEYTYESIHSNQWLQSLVITEVRKLEHADKNTQSQLCYTLFMYLMNGCNGVATAEQLKIHRSTLNYRLERIKEIIGEKLSDSQGKEILLLSLLISRNAYTRSA